MKLVDAAAVGLSNGDDIVVDLHLLALLRQMPQQVGDISPDSAYVSTLQLNPSKIAKLVEPKRPVYGKLVFADLPELCFFRIELILNIPDQLFEHVLQRDNT